MRSLSLVLALIFFSSTSNAAKVVSDCDPQGLFNLEDSLKVMEGDINRLNLELQRMDITFTTKLSQYVISDLEQLKKIQAPDLAFAQAVKELDGAMEIFKAQPEAVTQSKVEQQFYILASLVLKHGEDGRFNPQVMIGQVRALSEIRTEGTKVQSIRNTLTQKFLNALEHIKGLHSQCGVREA